MYSVNFALFAIYEIHLKHHRLLDKVLVSLADVFVKILKF